VRRYRADRLLRREFEAMRSRVLTAVRARLRAAGVRLDLADLEACYAMAWHGLYTTMLEGEIEVANPEGWLVLVTYRRAIDEHRTRVRTATYTAPAGGERSQVAPPDTRAPERDLANELDDRARLRQLMEGLRARLSPRERRAAALCYLQGCSRAQAAEQLGISEARMRKLMDGRPGAPGVAA
jgi:RNA polymerase sigma factor (sigma-70 family)